VARAVAKTPHRILLDVIFLLLSVDVGRNIREMRRVLEARVRM
jgi:hypothetical protein